LRIKAEQEMALNGVNDTFNHFVYHYDTGCNKVEQSCNELVQMMHLRFRDNAPRRPPRLIIVGPPGSGRTTLANEISRKFGMVVISPMNLVNAEAKKNPAIRIKIDHAQESGQDVPDDILQRVVDTRLNQSDCRVNGWVLDGFPQSFSQVALLTQMQVKPSLVIFLEQKDDECLKRLVNRRVDPFTG
jgi:adenylate kinase